MHSSLQIITFCLEKACHSKQIAVRHKNMKAQRRMKNKGEQEKYEMFFGENRPKKKGSSVLVYARVCVTKISGTSQRFKVPITAERGSNGISATRRAQMAPKSSESFCKGHKKNTVESCNPFLTQPPISAANRFLGPLSAGWYQSLIGLLRAQQSLFVKRVTKGQSGERPWKS